MLDGKFGNNLPAGTRVITRTERNGLRAGSVGTITVAPARHDGLFVVEFPDGRSAEFRRGEIRSEKRSLDEVYDELRGTPESFLSGVAYECVVGSQAYGLAHAGSDEDVRGFYVAPAESFIGLPGIRPPKQIDGKKDPITKKPLPGQDFTFWEVRRYVELLLKGNPSTIETIYTPIVKTETDLSRSLRDERDRFLSRRVIGSYAGYALSQFTRMRSEVDSVRRQWKAWDAVRDAGNRSTEPPDVPREEIDRAYLSKHAAHLIRTLKAGAHAVRTGEMIVEVPEDQRALIRSIRQYPPPIDEVYELARRIIAEEIDPYVEASPLPEQPDIGFANEWLVEVASRWSPPNQSRIIGARG